MFFICVAISVIAIISGVILIEEGFAVLGWIGILIGIGNAAYYIWSWRRGDGSGYEKIAKRIEIDCGLGECGDCGDPGCGGCS